MGAWNAGDGVRTQVLSGLRLREADLLTRFTFGIKAINNDCSI